MTRIAQKLWIEKLQESVENYERIQHKDVLKSTLLLSSLNLRSFCSKEMERKEKIRKRTAKSEAIPGKAKKRHEMNLNVRRRHRTMTLLQRHKKHQATVTFNQDHLLILRKRGSGAIVPAHKHRRISIASKGMLELELRIVLAQG
ncbi:hypothetical protein RB195_006102 [Necator americanus]|uniref:Uncharacterized protein n=1 Tax=Necator americanus TaxID=51031 RepID=A0ABR1BST4_NECAM